MVKMYHMNTMAVYQAMIEPEDLSTLNEAQASSDWPEWEKAIHAKLKQLAQFGTWKLIDCPSDAIPIPNKWVLWKKYNKLGELTKYKAHLMVKGYAQWPGFDFMDTFALVVRLETIRAVLAIVIAKNLKMQQMDVIGAYLNGYLKENVYMDQPNGYNNSTNQVCWLQKTLYGLKQSGHEWNKELDRRLKAKGFVNLQSDPCMYI